MFRCGYSLSLILRGYTGSVESIVSTDNSTVVPVACHKPDETMDVRRASIVLVISSPLALISNGCISSELCRRPWIADMNGGCHNIEVGPRKKFSKYC